MKFTSLQNTRQQPRFVHEVPTRPAPQIPFETTAPFVTAADLQSRPMATGRRPTGTRLPTPPPSASNPAPVYEPVQPRSGKARLNLLNPMSLLARRRTSQAITQLSAESLATQRTNDYPASFDPRIRGTVVHDFSAPRAPRRNLSYVDVAAAENSASQTANQRSPIAQIIEANSDENSSGPWSGGNHTPVFTENFEEEQYPAAGPHVRSASDLSDLPLPKPPYAKGVSKPMDPSLVSKSNGISERQSQPPRRISDRKPVSNVEPPVPPKAEEEEEVSQPRRISIDPAATPPKATKHSRKEPSRNVSGISTKSVSGLPKHMKSTSSRFSFDMMGAAEQERLLEDRHRQRALEKKNERGDDLDDEEEEFDYDDMMDEDGLEERIPGVNADLEDEEDDLEDILDDDDRLEEPIPGVNADLEEEDVDSLQNSQNMAGFTFQQSALTSPMSPYTPGMVSTPRDANGEVIGFAFTKDSPYITTTQDLAPSPLFAPNPSLPDVNGALQGVGLQGIEKSSPIGVERESSHVDLPSFPQVSGIDDDDLYFDDGIIDEIGDVEEGFEFDESVFDNLDTDQYGRPIKSFSSLPTLYSPPTLTSDPSPSFKKISEADEHTPRPPDTLDSAIIPTTIPPTGALAPKPSVIGNTNLANAPSQNLTQDSLAAYQSALAAAAHTAAANGKFNRRDSTAADALSPSSQSEPHPGLIPDSSQTSHYEPFSPSYELEDDFDYDDALEDDPIIAAANAEALANDCDGFYGQEFGFYSAPAASEAEYVNGGYFGPRGVEGVDRSTSGRVASREPNLTPITERSEYSNRNSFMSPSMHGPGSITSPGLVQLAGMLNNYEYDGDMSLNSLLKLRRGAWGGSQASLHSSTGSPRSAGGAEDMSPAGGLPPWAQGSANFPQDSAGRHRRQNSGFSIGALSEESDREDSKEESPDGSPTLTTINARPASPPMSSEFSKQGNSGEERQFHSTSPVKGDKGVRSHRYTGSAGSISYSKEDDPSSPTGERWVLERRHTAESGEVIFGREVVSGGRI
ncbi:hypothetical protein D0Z07_0692 [Hyphodiscus hymeniophilus]|uniref:Uncharacterized protein n=1 Tax=Hyphodiscus hymeniophilus TaxID=353542 RepID=A0A9P7B0Z7_9HELO|nr:hypothetical protein D0Z07_0692 [Hyphodiscus hymeniophilus]